MISGSKNKIKQVRSIEQRLSRCMELMIKFVNSALLDKDTVDNSKPLTRLRGGANTRNTGIPIMVLQAIESASKHGIKLCWGEPNAASGNCAFESVLNNINFRSCFRAKFLLPVLFYRYQWMTDLEKQSKNFPMLGAGFTDEEKK